MTLTESHYLYKTSCDSCGSSDANAVYDDGHTFCFSCNAQVQNAGAEPRAPKPDGFDVKGEVRALRARGISEDMTRKFNYTCDGDSHYANYADPKTGEFVAAKVRQSGKRFSWIGNPSRAGLYGQHLWKPGRRLILTEGEIDTLSVAELDRGRWPVCSVKNGAAGAKKNCAEQIQWLMQWDEIVLMFDNDDAGKAAAVEVASLFPAGKVKIATLPLKDANECLLSDTPGDITQAMFQARPVQPKGIVQAADCWEQVLKTEDQSEYPFPFECLNKAFYGLRTAEICLVTGGTGTGKSAFVKEILYSLLMSGKTIGALFLEESLKRTLTSFCGMAANMNLVLPDMRERISDDDLGKAFNATAGTKRLFLQDTFGGESIHEIYNQIRYMVKNCGCEVIALDHISMVLSATAADGDERRALDQMMTELRVLVQELDVVFILVSHLKRPPSQGHEEGGITSLSQIRSSAATAQLSDSVIGLERDQQDKDRNNVMTIRALKNRYAGITGIAGYVQYDHFSGRMVEVETGDGRGNEAESDGEF